MPCAQGSRSSLSYIVESTRGTTPAGSFQNLPYTTHSLNLTKELIEGNDIQSHAQQTVSRHGNRQVGGEIVASLRDGSYDDLLESAFMGTWTSDVLKLGTTPKYFSFEDYASDIDQVRLFKGCTVSSLAISIAPNQMINTTFNILGSDMELTQTEATQIASTNLTPFDSYSGTLDIGDSGGALTTVGYVTSLDFTIDNVTSPTFTIGSPTSTCYNFSTKTVSGSMTCIYQDAALLNRFIDEVESAFSVSVNDPSGTNEYEFFFPRVKLNTADVPVAGGELRSIEISFTALWDETEDTTVVLTRPTSV